MLISLRTLTVIVFFVYCALTCYTGYILLKNNSGKVIKHTHRKLSLPDDDEDFNPWGEEFEREKQSFKSFVVQKSASKWWTNQSLDFQKQFYKSKKELSNLSYEPINIEIWGKAAIGLYLWEHILGGKLENKMEGIWSYGFKRIDNLKLKFRTGPGVIASKAPNDVENLLLILNGRSEDKIAFAKTWLDVLPQFHSLRSVLLLILGNEKCKNDWIIPYMARSGGLINTTFIVYDSPFVNNIDVFQFPLGVATYRGFPKVDPKKLDLENARPYICNFLGSIYPHSSREKLMKVIQHHNLTQYCFIKARYEWQPSETKNSLLLYVQSLRLSDLTLNPVGMNSECYRIYEALSFGSVPVVENVMTPGMCGGPKSPLRLLKALNAPIMYINDWSELPYLISQELRMTLEEKVNRRIKIIEWYENFKLHIREQLISIIKDHVYKR